MTNQNEFPPGKEAQVLKAYDLLMECLNLNKIDTNVGISAMWSIMMTQFKVFGLSWEQAEEHIDRITEKAKPSYMKGNSSPEELGL
jgi:hypothetical protein